MGDGGTVFKTELEAALRELLREELGREPTEQEVAATVMLREQERLVRSDRDLDRELLDALEAALRGDPLALSTHDTL